MGIDKLNDTVKGDLDNTYNWGVIKNLFPITTTEITDGTITDTDLASPNNATWKTVFSSQGLAGVDAAISTVFLMGSKTNALAPSLMNVSTGSWTIGNDALLPDLFVINDADFDVAGKTEQFRIVCGTFVNASAAPGGDFTFSLRKVDTVAGGVDILTITVNGTANGATAIAAPGTSTITTGVGTPFAIPADGVYCLAVVNSAAIANNSIVGCFAQLQVNSI